VDKQKVLAEPRNFGRCGQDGAAPEAKGWR
jgi:hypothetical protein